MNEFYNNAQLGISKLKNSLYKPQFIIFPFFFRIKLGGDHSLVMKWMPSEGKRLDKETKGFSHLCRKLKWKPKKLRQHFAKYRSELVETKLMKKKGHTIKYNSVPGKAMLKYAKGAFIRHDKDRFVTWKNSKTKKVHTAVLHPLDVVLKYHREDTVDPLMEEIWNNFKVPETVEDTIGKKHMYHLQKLSLFCNFK